MKKYHAVAAFAAAAALVTGLAFPSQAQDLQVRSAERAEAVAAEAGQPQAVNAVLRDVARGMARALEGPSMRSTVAKAVAERFDGDVNVLYRDLANRRLSHGATVRENLAAHVAASLPAASRAAVLERLDAAAMALPRLQVAVPIHFDRWQVDTEVPLVAWMPVDVDDMELTEVEAFDAAGNVYSLDPWTEPSEAVVVISLNERTDVNGFLLSSSMEEGTASGTTSLQGSNEVSIIEDPDSGGGDSGGTTSTTCTSRVHSYGDKEIFYMIKINNDHEPWTSGSAEIYASYAFVDNTGVKGEYLMYHVDDEGKWYTINGHLFYWQSYWGNTFIMSIWERDGNDFGTFTYTYNGFSYSVRIYNGDDPLGSNPISFNDPTCGYYGTGDAEYKLRHTAP